MISNIVVKQIGRRDLSLLKSSVKKPPYKVLQLEHPSYMT